MNQIAFLLAAISAFVFALSAGKREPINVAKYTKVECSATGKTCMKYFCNVKAISRDKTIVNMGCDLNRPLNRFYLNITTSLRSQGVNYRQLVDVKNVDACAVLDNVENFPMFKSVYDDAIRTFPGLFHKCPYTTLKLVNGSLSVMTNNTARKNPLPLIPSGNYKQNIKFFDDLDELIADITFFYVLRQHFNVFEF